MYKVTLEDDDTVIRIRRDLMDQATVSRLLDLVNLSAVLEDSRFADAKAKILDLMNGEKGTGDVDAEIPDKIDHAEGNEASISSKGAPTVGKILPRAM